MKHIIAFGNDGRSGTNPAISENVEALGKKHQFKAKT